MCPHNDAPLLAYLVTYLLTCLPVAMQQLQFVNGAGFSTFAVSVDEHYLLVYSIDAVVVQIGRPYPLVLLQPGQRVSVLICPASTEVRSCVPPSRKEIECVRQSVCGRGPLVCGLYVWLGKFCCEC